MLKIGIIGVGNIAQVHIAGIKKSDKAKIAAICDIDKDKLNTVGDSLEIPEKYRFENYMDLINCDEVDAVEICTPNHLHVPISIEVAKKGKALEVEKPLSVDYSDVEGLLSAIEESKVPNMICFSYRFLPAVRYAKHLIEKGALGKIINVNIEYLKSSAFIPNRRLEWRFEKKYAGCGVLGDLGVHLIDMTRFLIGDFKTVSAVTSIVVDKRKRLDSEEYGNVETDDITSFVARLENDVIANFLVTRCAIGNENTIKYEIYGTDGVINFNLNNPNEITLCVGEVDRETQSLHTVNVPGEYYSDQEATFIGTALGEAQTHLPTVTEGAECQKIVDAILKSAEEGIIIKL